METWGCRINHDVFPGFAFGVADCEGPNCGVRWLPILAPQLPLPIPRPLAKGIPEARREELRAQAERIVAAQVYPAWKKGIALLQPLIGRANDDAMYRFRIAIHEAAAS